MGIKLLGLVIVLIATALTVYCLKYGGNKYDIYLDQEVPDTVTKEWRDNIKLLQNATKYDTITIHINADGGDYYNAMYLVTAIKYSKANTIAIVETRAMSGDAYIALSAKKLIMLSNTFLMVHTVSGYGNDCSEFKGKLDRTHDSVKKCQQALNIIEESNKKVINSLRLLTNVEKSQVNEGYDIYLNDVEINNRLKDIGNAKSYIAPKDIDPTYINTTSLLTYKK